MCNISDQKTTVKSLLGLKAYASTPLSILGDDIGTVDTEINLAALHFDDALAAGIAIAEVVDKACRWVTAVLRVVCSL